MQTSFTVDLILQQRHRTSPCCVLFTSTYILGSTLSPAPLLTPLLCLISCLQYLSLHFGPLEVAFADYLAEIGILADGMDFPKKCGDMVTGWAAKTGIPTSRCECTAALQALEMQDVCQ
jgi:hypothetical protein